MYFPKILKPLFLSEKGRPLLQHSHSSGAAPEGTHHRTGTTATYLSVRRHDQRSRSSGLRFAGRQGQGGGQAGQQGRGRLQTELVDAGCGAGWRVGIL